MSQIYSILLFLLIGFSGFAQGFTVKNFTADIYLNKEGYFDVIEKYDIEFTSAKHGIFRDIITKFDFQDEAGKVSKREIYISEIDVPGEKFKTNEIFGKQFGDKLNIKIGDKNTLISGAKHYEIQYRVKNALIFTDDLAQLYWNIKPSDWAAVFFQINFTIHTPEGTSLSPENCFVYSGNTGVTESSTEFNYDYSGNIFSAKSRDEFYSTPGQNVTVLVKLPKSIIQEADFTPPFWKRYGWMGVLGLLLLAMVLFIRKKLQGDKIIPATSYYPPKGIDPAMAGVLIDNTTDYRDVTCLLPYWATQGLIRMEEITKGERSLYGDLKLIKIKDIPENVPGYEYNFFHKIFNNKNEVLASTLGGAISEPKALLAKKSEHYYPEKKNNLIWIIPALSVVWAFFSITLFPFLAQSYIDIESSKFIAFVIINFLFFFLVFPVGFAWIAIRNRAKNEEGKSIMPELLGFYNFIKVAEVDRIKALLKEDPYYFEKTMPYAVAFNLLKEWSAKFDGLIQNAPDWYRSSTGTQFRFHIFANSFTSSMSVARASMVISPSSGGSSSSSSGGGSSGGGAGGGGGGSW